MSWRESLSPVRMERIALVVPEQHTRDLLLRVARSAVVELDLPFTPGVGPEELDRAAECAVLAGPVAGLVGWTPARELPDLTAALSAVGAAVVPLARPRSLEPPTLLTGPRQQHAGRTSMSRTLVDTYGTVPYADVDPSRLAALAYLVMFGMMFGDAGQGAVLLVLGLLVRRGSIRRLEKLRNAWLFVAGAGLSSMFFGALYGEFFGPTGVLPVLWLEPLASPLQLMSTALLFGAFLLAGAYALGTVNRVREGGWGYALYARSGIAGSLLFVAVGLLAWGLVAGLSPVVVAGVVLAVAALVFIFVGLYVDAGGGGTGAMQAGIETMDTVVRLGSNVVSFARLAAFGLVHAALLAVVWDGTTALWGPGWGAVAAIIVFVVGNVLTFALEALVAAVQALRLEYYELFSRIFTSEGRPFLPWAPIVPGPPSPAGSSSAGDSSHEHHIDSSAGRRRS